MEAKKLIIDGVDMIGTFYSQVANDDEQDMYISMGGVEEHDWYRIEEFGYSKIICMFRHEIFDMEYERVELVRIGKWDDDLRDFKYYIYTNRKN